MARDIHRGVEELPRADDAIRRKVTIASPVRTAPVNSLVCQSPGGGNGGSFSAGGRGQGVT